MIGLAKIILINFASTLFINTPSGAGIDKAKFISHLNNIVPHLTKTVQEAEATFMQQGISDDSRVIEIIPDLKSDSYIKSLQYDLNNFRIKLQLKNIQIINTDSSMENKDDETDENINRALVKTFSGKYIVLVPIFAPDNKAITTWECITNIGINSANFFRNNQFSSTTNGQPSIISELSSVPYLANCSFYDSTDAI